MKALIMLASLLAWSFSTQAISYSPKLFSLVGKHWQGKQNSIFQLYSAYPDEQVNLLYWKGSKGEFVYKGLQASRNLRERIPSDVLTYIGKNIAMPKLKETQALNSTLDAIRTAVERALDQRYKNKILNEGAELVKDPGYLRGHYHSKWYAPNYYYDYVPVLSGDTTKHFLTNVITDTRFGGLKYLTDTLKHFGYHHDTKPLTEWGNVFIKRRKTLNTYTVKDWGFTSQPFQSDATFHKRGDSCKFVLTKKTMVHGDAYPLFAAIAFWGWNATFCNYYASDLRKLVFGSPIFNTNGCNADQATIRNNKDFLEIKKAEMLTFSRAGYFVFVIGPTHITTIYPDGKQVTSNKITYPANVIQAGSETGIYDLAGVWGMLPPPEDTNAFVYLGHLKN